MAKSKQVKQAEALARKRSNYNCHLGEIMKYRAGGSLERHLVMAYGSAKDNPQTQAAEARFQKYLDEAQLDEAGNPLFIYKVDKSSSFNRAGVQQDSPQNKQFVGRLNRPNTTSIHEYLDTGISK